jgi:hypothetical protein
MLNVVSPCYAFGKHRSLDGLSSRGNDAWCLVPQSLGAHETTGGTAPWCVHIVITDPVACGGLIGV